jgi:hypothetical protein
VGSSLYNRATAVERVAGRWPPRATAALRAFLSLSDAGEALDYDLAARRYEFPAAAIVSGRGQQP